MGFERGYPCPLQELNDGLETTNTERHAPHSLPEALDALEADHALITALGADLIANYVAIKRQEVAELDGKTEAEAVAYYLHYI